MVRQRNAEFPGATGPQLCAHRAPTEHAGTLGDEQFKLSWEDLFSLSPDFTGQIIQVSDFSIEVEFDTSILS